MSKETAKELGRVIVGVSTVFLVLDAIDLAFTVRDLVKNEGSDAARILRDFVYLGPHQLLADFYQPALTNKAMYVCMSSSYNFGAHSFS